MTEGEGEGGGTLVERVVILKRLKPLSQIFLVK